MKNILITLLMSFVSLTVFCQDSTTIDKVLLLEWASKNSSIRKHLETTNPDWFEIVMTRDTIDFQKNKVVAGSDDLWIFKPSRINPSAIRMNSKKFRFKEEVLVQDTIKERVLVISPR